MGEWPGNVVLPGTKRKAGKLMLKDEDEAGGHVLTSITKDVNLDNWRYPNFVGQAYGESAGIRFIEAMGITVPFDYDANDEQDAQKLAADIKKHLADRDAKLADAAMFRHLMRTGGSGKGNQATQNLTEK